MEDQKRTRKEILDEVTRTLILDAAKKILFDEGTQGFTMDRVAVQAGVAKGTLYLHFRDKDDLLQETVEKGFEPFFILAETIFENDLSPEKKLEEFSLQGYRFFEQQRQLFNIVMRSRELKTNRHMDEDAPYWGLVEKIAQVFDEGTRQGLFKPLNSTKIAGMFLDAQGALILQQLLGKSTNHEENVHLVMDVFLNGIRA